MLSNAANPISVAIFNQELQPKIDTATYKKKPSFFPTLYKYEMCNKCFNIQPLKKQFLQKLQQMQHKGYNVQYQPQQVLPQML